MSIPKQLFKKLFFCILIFLPAFAGAQKLITGTIKDANGSPLSAATVSEKGHSGNSTSSDENGKFKLSVKGNTSSVIITSVGFKEKEIKIDNTSELSVSLEQEAAQLSEVVVVGYGTQKKVNVIGAISQVGSKEINNRAVTQTSQALTGQMPGVTVIQSSGRPGASPGNIEIRGVGSFGAGATPLVLIDGIPGNLDFIDPNDIASVSVLKDAASAAIYGSRAADGVVLVTTKFGQAGADGKVKVNYNGYAGTQRATRYPKFASSWQYARALNEAVPNTYSQADIDSFRLGTSPYNYPNTDWTDLIFKKGTFQTGNNVAVSNRTKNTQYMLSLGYVYQNGIIADNDFRRYSARLNMVNNLSSRLKLTTIFSGIQNATHEPAGVQGIIQDAVKAAAIYAPLNSDGTFGGGKSGQGTPYSSTRRTTYNNILDNNFLVNLKLDWEIVSGLTASAIAGYTNRNLQTRNFVGLQVLNPALTLGPATLTVSNEQISYQTLQELLEYKKSIKHHNFDLLLGHTYEYSLDRLSSAYRNNFPSNDVSEISSGDASSQTNSGSAAEWALDSYFGRFQYNYASKYLAEVTVRRDGSSRFPPSLRYATFPGFAVGYRISEEPFFKKNVSWINDLKIRASYGTLGNQNIGNYGWQSVFVTGTNYNYVIGNGISTGAAVNTIVDSTIHWESTRTKDIGIEGTAFNRKLSFSAGYFDRYTYNILVSPGGSVSNVLGFTVGVSNSGKLSNKGWEFSLGYKDNIGKFSYGVSGNLSIVNNKVLDLGVGNIAQPNGLVGNGSTYFIGYPLQIYYGYKTDGLFTDTADIKNYAVQTAINAKPQPGDIRYKDISGPNGKPDGKVDATYDRTVLGSNIPKYTYALSLNGGFKGFDLTVLLQGVANVSGYLDNYSGKAFYQEGNIQQWQYNNHWTPANPNRYAAYPRLEPISNQGTGNTLTSDFWMLNGGYLRIKNIQLGYTFGKDLLKRLKIQSVRVYVSAENLATFSQYPQGWDPEITGGSVDAAGNANAGGNVVAGSYYPILANYTFGVNVNF